jgi:hypothetical protein
VPVAPPSSVPSLPPPDLPDGRSSFRLGDPVPPAAPPTPVRPAPPPGEVLLPDPLPPGGVPPTAPPRQILGEPLRPDDAPAPERTSEKPADTASRPPVGFLKVPGRDGLASGRLPGADELDWLAANGFRTVLVVHDPKADVDELTAAAAKRNLRVVAVPADPADLGPAYEAFARAVADRGGKPVYAADADPARLGALWFALFRRQELAGDEVARLRARPLGLTDGPWADAAAKLLDRP